MNFVDENDPETSEVVKVSEVRTRGTLRQKRSIHEAAGSADEADQDIKDVVTILLDEAYCKEFPDHIHVYREGDICLTQESCPESSEYVHFEILSHLHTASQQYPTPFTIRLDSTGNPLLTIMEIPRQEGYLTDIEDDSTPFAEVSFRVMYTEEQKAFHSMQMTLMFLEH